MNAQECGFEIPENYQTYESINTGRSSSSTEATQSQNACINVCFKILRDNNGSNAAINPSIIPQILAEMNSRFNPHGISETGAEILINRSYVDVGDPKNNPCFKDAITTIVAPNPIHNGIINVILNKPSHNTPCNYKDFNEPQYFNSELDQINNSVTIFDYNGNQVYRKVFETNEFVIDDANLHSGNNYIVNLFTNEGGFKQQVIIVE